MDLLIEDEKAQIFSKRITSPNAHSVEAKTRGFRGAVFREDYFRFDIVDSLARLAIEISESGGDSGTVNLISSCK